MMKARAKMLRPDTTCIYFDICHRIAPLRKLFSFTLSYIFMVKIANNHRAISADLPQLVRHLPSSCSCLLLLAGWEFHDDSPCRFDQFWTWYISRVQWKQKRPDTWFPTIVDDRCNYKILCHDFRIKLVSIKRHLIAFFLTPYYTLPDTISHSSWHRTTLFLTPYRILPDTVPHPYWHHIAFFLAPYHTLSDTVSHSFWHHVTLFLTPYHTLYETISHSFWHHTALFSTTYHTRSGTASHSSWHHIVLFLTSYHILPDTISHSSWHRIEVFLTPYHTSWHRIAFFLIPYLTLPDRIMTTPYPNYFSKPSPHAGSSEYSRIQSHAWWKAWNRLFEPALSLNFTMGTQTHAPEYYSPTHLQGIKPLFLCFRGQFLIYTIM